MKKGVMCVAMLMSDAEAEMLSTATVGQHAAILGLRQRTSTAVRAPKDLNLLSCQSTAVAFVLSYCCACGPVDEQVR